MKTPGAARRGDWCNGCGTSLAGRAVVRLSFGDDAPGERYYCPACADARLRCTTCGRALDGAVGGLFALAADPTRFYCPACWARPHCDGCGRPVGEVSYQRPDGRVFCARCHATAVYDPAAAACLYAAVQKTAARVLGLELQVGAGLHLASREQIAALRADAPGAAAPGAGDADYVGLFVYTWRRRAVYVEYGLPRIFFCEVAAHEFAHVWQAECAPLLADAELREGFAEWVAYKVMESWGCRLRLARFRQRQDLYGAGLRRMLAWEAARGVPGLLDLVQRGGDA